jgi:hypothetical protein
MSKVLLVIGYLVLTALAANAKGIYVESVPAQIDQDAAKELAENKKPVYKCKALEADEGKIRSISGDDLFTASSLSGTRRKTMVRKALKNGKPYYLCNLQRLNTVTDSLANK